MSHRVDVWRSRDVTSDDVVDEDMSATDIITLSVSDSVLSCQLS